MRYVDYATCTGHIFEGVTDLINYSKTVAKDDPVRRADDELKPDIGRIHWIRGTFKTPVSVAYPGIWKELEKPWAEGITLLNTLRGQIKPYLKKLRPVESIKRRRIWDENDGIEWDRDRGMSGQPAWMSSKRLTTKAVNQYYKLAINVSTQSTIASDSILWRGLVGLVIAEMLEKAGYRVEIDLFESTLHTYVAGYPKNSFIVVPLKRAGEPLSIERLVTCVSGWFFRTIIFDSKWHPQKSLSLTLGGPQHFPRIEPHCLEKLKGSYADSRFSVIDNIWSLPEAVSHVKKVLNDKEMVKND